MLEFEGRQIPNELREIVDPQRTVLLVWDMQNDQAGGSFNKDALIRHFCGKTKRPFGFAVG
jgi:hypothetical protein